MIRSFAPLSLPLLATVFVLLQSLVPAMAWNRVGHMCVASVTYSKLSKTTRSKIAQLLTLNPDYANWVAQLPTDLAAKDKDRVLFMIAATWADRIKMTAGYQEDNAQDANECGPVSDQNLGYVDRFRHRCWHFVDIAFTPDGTLPLPTVPSVNAQERVTVFRASLNDSNNDLVSYDLCWMLHLVGDLHQPLHCTTRVSQVHPKGDAGGNAVTVTHLGKTIKLHAYWDDLLGPTDTPIQDILKISKQLPSANPSKTQILDPKQWADEGVALAQASVYTSPVGPGAGPFVLTPKYEKAALSLARKQVALAGARLAKMIQAEWP